MLLHYHKGNNTCAACGKAIEDNDHVTKYSSGYIRSSLRCDGKAPGAGLDGWSEAKVERDAEQNAKQSAEQSAERSAEQNAKQSEGLRYDSGKPRYDLIPPDALAEYVRVMTIGAEKYAPRNWELGMKWSRCVGSMLRHAFAWLGGETNDPETRCHHLAHVAWNALALVAYSKRRIGENNLPFVERDLNNSQVLKGAMNDE